MARTGSEGLAAAQIENKMNHPPTISVVLPTHNGSRYLDQSIASVTAQTYRQWELIVVDDASSDETPAKIAAWTERDPRIGSLRLEQRRKLPGALNEGFHVASGRFLTWTSDDNWYADDALARMLEVLQTKPGVDIVYAAYHLVEADGSPAGSEPARSPEHLVLGNCVGPCFLFRRAVIERLGGYDEELFLTEDYDFWLRASLSFRLEPLDEPLYFYRRHAESLSAKQERAVSEAAEKAVNRWLQEATWLSKTMRGQALEALGLRALVRGDVKAGRRYLFRAMFYLGRPPLFRSCRSYAVDWILGSHAGHLIRRFWRPGESGRPKAKS